jgi:PAS domain S-box-containing protein
LGTIDGLWDCGLLAFTRVNWVIAIWSATVGASLLMVVMMLLVWSHDLRTWANLCFAVSVLGVVGLAVGEIGTMYAESPEAFARAVRWTHLVYGIGVLGSLGFIHFYFQTGMRWLLALAVALRLLVVVANFTTGVNLHFTAIGSLEKVTFLGQQVSVVGAWVPNPWIRLGVLASLVQLAYVVDAAIRLWRAGTQEARRRAMVVGGALAFTLVAAPAQAALVAGGLLRMPFIVSFPFLVVVVAMGYELSRDFLRAAQVTRELGESNRQLELATEAANLGIWSRRLPSDEIWATAKWRQLIGFTKSERLDFDVFMQRMHPDDRDRVREAFMEATQNTGHYEVEYRVTLPDGETRWVASRGKVEFNGSHPVLLRGASMDITRRRLAEESALSLSGRLINAQEAERMRLARELHDDLSQSLAFLGIELDLFGQKPPTSSDDLRVRMEHLSEQVKGLSSSVHRLSHDLHPAKLEQLGLLAAVRGLCRDVSTAHNLAIEFVPGEVPRLVPNDTALCLYRVAQEGLQNVVKHSGSASATVELSWIAGELRLVVADQGCGFDSGAMADDGSLGLTSMRERVRLVRGQIAVWSRKSQGTRISVQVPVIAADGTPLANSVVASP